MEDQDVTDDAGAKWLPLLALLVVLIGGIAVFRDVGSFRFVQFDDPALVVGNPYVNRGLTGDSLIWAFTFHESGGNQAEPAAKCLWAPLSFVSHAMDVEIAGMDPRWHHLVNLGLHLATTVLVFVFFLLLVDHLFVAAVIAAVFCFHPMRVESVAWVSERKDVLSGFFVFCTLNLYLLWHRRRSSPGKTAARALWWAAVATFAIACLAKPMAVTLPALLILLDAWFSGKMKHSFNLGGVFRFLLQQLKEKWPFVAVSLAMSAATVYLKLLHDLTPEIDSAPGLLERLAEIPAAILFYLERTVFPKDLYPVYLRYPHSFALSTIIGSGVIIGITWAAWRWRARFPEWLFGWGWFLICLTPALGLVYLGPSFTSDRYTYVAHCGLAFAVAVTAWRAMERSRRASLVLLYVSLAVLFTIGGWSRYITGVWRDSRSLFSRGIEAQPESPQNWSNYGALLLMNGNDRKAVKYLRRAIDLGGGPEESYNLGVALTRAGGEADEIIALFRYCVTQDPEHSHAMLELGMLLTDPAAGKMGNLEEGGRWLERACELQKFDRSGRIEAAIKRLLSVYRETGNEDGIERVREFQRLRESDQEGR